MSNNNHFKDNNIILFSRFAYTMNEKFRIIIAVQFIASMLVVCSNLYRLAKTTLSPKYIPLMLYTICMCSQILIYCWYGNEIKLKVLILCIYTKCVLIYKKMLITKSQHYINNRIRNIILNLNLTFILIYYILNLTYSCNKEYYICNYIFLITSIVEHSIFR